MLSTKASRAVGCRRWYSAFGDSPAPREDVWPKVATAWDPLPELRTTSDWQTLLQRRRTRQAIIDRFDGIGSTQTRQNTWQPHHPLLKPAHPSQLTISSLMAAGAHFGHNHGLMNNNYLPFAYGERGGVTIIDLDKTLPLLRRAVNVTRAVAARNGSIIFVGTRPHLRRIVAQSARRLPKNGYHVGQRWLPGTLTNSVQFFGPERSQKTQIVPDLVIILNPLNNMHVIRECSLSHVPTIGIIDSNVDPRIVMYPIPANDDSTRTAELISGVLSIAAREGLTLERGTEEQPEKKERHDQRKRTP